MVALLPSRPGRLADTPSFTRSVGGAESNVACALAAAGHRVRWISRVGADGFGDHLLAAVAAHGVDVSAVRRDPHRPTGVYFRTAADRADPAYEVVYHRAGSAASAMSPHTVPYEEAAAGRVLHLSGITAALSPGCRALVAALTARRPGRPRPLVSFDLNHRPALWPDPATARRALGGAARGADLVFAGADEAAQALGPRGADALRAALPEPDVLVVKEGARGATLFARTPPTGPPPTRAVTAAPPGATAPGATARGATVPGATAKAPAGGAATRRATSAGAPLRIPDVRISVPAPRVDVVSYAGASDAFAAGFLGATLRGLPLAARLRHGHLAAAAALTAPGDLAPVPDGALVDRLAGLDGTAWGRLRLGPGWTDAGPDDEEVRTR
ncbi:sugar kinase [Streptomyces changanensis]|uniref:Sugar kinase n=2 Tax=Streptomyces changanensis TaxID=2964669 RepID=A0ABY5NFU4_9ACTN|nr:sugar kinase [Streptomyces changanensis]